MTECLRCLRQHTAYACPDCGYMQPRATYRLGTAPVRAPLTPRVELLRAERLLARALLELGALEADRSAWMDDIDYRWAVRGAQEWVEQMRHDRDLAALSLDPEVVSMQLDALPAGWRPQIQRDSGPA